jgi:hypothetical protein
MVMYFANPTGSVVEYMTKGIIGYIDTPLQGNKRPPGVVWCADNGCFNDKTFTEERWWKFLVDNSHDLAKCRFATAPDVVGDAEATLVRSSPWLPKIRDLGYPAAYVLQDGSDIFPPPWQEFDALFIGGSTEFKLGPVARDYAVEARRRGLWVHGGRVNSYKRMRAMEAIGCLSVDGTYLVFGPDINLPKLLNWIRKLEENPAMFEWGEMK